MGCGEGRKASYSHGHMDASSFVFETFGDGWAERWVCDGGTEGYTALETAGIDLWNMCETSTRWDVFRYGERAHSVFTVDDGRPMVDALVTLTQQGDSGGGDRSLGGEPRRRPSEDGETFKIVTGCDVASHALEGVACRAACGRLGPVSIAVDEDGDIVATIRPRMGLTLRVR